jgi:4-hydroxybenzoate polyprenyltransferase
MKKAKVLWLIYRKLRPALGISFAFILMSGIFFGAFNFQLIVTAFGFLFIEVFGNFYNDCCDFSEDMRNKRKDKFTTSGLIGTETALSLSILFASIGLFLLVHTSISLMLLGILYVFLLFIYSHRSVRLKGKVFGYAIVSSPFFLLPIIMANMHELPLPSSVPLSLFFYFQCMYLLCQKDSTDPKDRKNIFQLHGWERSSNIIMFFGVSASLSLLFLCIFNPILIFVWMFNAVSKIFNIDNIRRKTVTRKTRSRFVLLEFVTPYLYSIGGAL